MEYKELLVNKETPILECMKILSKTAKKILFVIDKDGILIGSLTDGDIRRYILKTGSLHGTAEEACYKTPLKIYLGEDRTNAIQKAKSLKIDFIPVVSRENKIMEIIHLEYTDAEVITKAIEKLNLPVVIMAGGFGKRLEPFTKVLPKPLIPIGEKTMLEIIMEKFHSFGIDEFWITLNYKAKVIKAYLEDLNLPYKIKYLQEEKPLGTAGSLYMLKKELLQDAFILTNADTILNTDLIDLWNTHKYNAHDITMVVSAQSFRVPYGVCEIKNGVVLNLIEKPEYKFLVNVGVYIINKDILELVLEDEFFNATDLVTKAIESGKTVGVYPIHEDAWLDVGQWEEYRKTLERMKV